MQERIIVIGIGLVLLGVLLLVIGSFMSLTKSNMKSDIAIGGFIGPIPFGYFTSKGAFWAWLLMLAVMIVFYLILRKLN